MKEGIYCVLRSEDLIMQKNMTHNGAILKATLLIILADCFCRNWHIISKFHMKCKRWRIKKTVLRENKTGERTPTRYQQSLRNYSKWSILAWTHRESYSPMEHNKDSRSTCIQSIYVTGTLGIQRNAWYFQTWDWICKLNNDQTIYSNRTLTPNLQKPV